jgi:hypothetical protein
MSELAVERARYETARCQFDKVESENRLLARTLEKNLEYESACISWGGKHRVRRALDYSGLQGLPDEYLWPPTPIAYAIFMSLVCGLVVGVSAWSPTTTRPCRLRCQE